MSYKIRDQVSSIKLNTTSAKFPGRAKRDAASLGSTAFIRSTFHMVGLPCGFAVPHIITRIICGYNKCSLSLDNRKHYTVIVWLCYQLLSVSSSLRPVPIWGKTLYMAGCTRTESSFGCSGISGKMKQWVPHLSTSVPRSWASQPQCKSQPQGRGWEDADTWAALGFLQLGTQVSLWSQPQLAIQLTVHHSANPDHRLLFCG